MQPGHKAANRTFSPPGIFHLLSPAKVLEGDHTNPVWWGQVGAPGKESDETDRPFPMVIKVLDGQILICIELACALAAQALQLPVPAPAIVVAQREFLPGLPEKFKGESLLLIGSLQKTRDEFFAKVLINNPEADELIWSAVCQSPTGPQGAIWDELVINADRHTDNLIFDGLIWWLFDHDLALPKAAEFIKAPFSGLTRQQASSLVAKCNVLAEQMVMRHPDSHGLEARLNDFRRRSADLRLMAANSRDWSDADKEISEILSVTSALLVLIELRMAALAELIGQRLEKPHTPDLWTFRPQD